MLCRVPNAIDEGLGDHGSPLRSSLREFAGWLPVGVAWLAEPFLVVRKMLLDELPDGKVVLCVDYCAQRAFVALAFGCARPLSGDPELKRRSGAAFVGIVATPPAYPKSRHRSLPHFGRNYHKRTHRALLCLRVVGHLSRMTETLN